MVAPQMDQKRHDPLEKTHQKVGYVYIINMHSCYTTNSLRFRGED
jgi:hypothetical protein